MVTVQVHLDEETHRRAQSLAEERHCSIEDLLRDFLARPETVATPGIPVLGMFSDDPGLIDEIVEAAMKDRVEQPLRRTVA